MCGWWRLYLDCGDSECTPQVGAYTELYSIDMNYSRYNPGGQSCSLCLLYSSHDSVTQYCQRKPRDEMPYFTCHKFTRRLNTRTLRDIYQGWGQAGMYLIFIQNTMQVTFFHNSITIKPRQNAHSWAASYLLFHPDFLQSGFHNDTVTIIRSKVPSDQQSPALDLC